MELSSAFGSLCQLTRQLIDKQHSHASAARDSGPLAYHALDAFTRGEALSTEQLNEVISLVYTILSYSAALLPALLTAAARDGAPATPLPLPLPAVNWSRTASPPSTPSSDSSNSSSSSSSSSSSPHSCDLCVELARRTARRFREEVQEPLGRAPKKSVPERRLGENGKENDH